MTALTTELLKQRRIAGDLFCRLSCPPVKVKPDKIESKDKIGGGKAQCSEGEVRYKAREQRQSLWQERREQLV